MREKFHDPRPLDKDEFERVFYSPDDFLADRRAGQPSSPFDEPPQQRPKVSTAFIFGVLIGCAVMVPVWAIIYAVLTWVLR
jgi:hypothetical protein